MDTNGNNIYDMCDAMSQRFEEHQAQLARICETLDYLHSRPIPSTSPAETEAMAGAYVAAFELCLCRVKEVRERLVTVRPVIWANRRHLLEEQMRELEQQCDRLMMNRRALSERLGAAPTQMRMQVCSALEDLLQQMETLLRDIACKTSPKEFKNQVLVFSASRFYRERRVAFLSRVRASVLDECARQGVQLTEQRHYETFRRLLWEHPVYGAILQKFPGIYVNEYYRASAIEEMLRPRPDEDSHGIGHWMDLLTAAQLNKERSDWAAEIANKKRKQKSECTADGEDGLAEMGTATAPRTAADGTPGQLPGGRIAGAIRRLKEEGLLRFSYDHAWLMAAMNERPDMPHFALTNDFIAWLRAEGVEADACKSQVNRFRNQVRGHLPNWQFGDSKGQNADERRRRTTLAETFIAWATAGTGTAPESAP